MRILFYYILAALAITLLSCSTAADPQEPSGPQSVTVKRITELPYVGGGVTCVDVTPDGSVIAVVDGKLATVPTSGGAVTFHNSVADLLTAAVGGGGEVYQLTYRELWVSPSLGASPRKVDMFLRTGLTEDMQLSVQRNGQPYMFIRQYPNSALVYTSTDRGVTWVRVMPPTGGNITVGPNNTMYCSSNTAFCASHDGGTTWQQYPPVLPNYGGSVVTRSNGDVIYYVPKGGGLWISSNQGASFTQVSPFNQAPFHTEIIEGADGMLYSLSTSNSTGGASGSTRLTKSTDGVTWQHVLFAQSSDFDISGSTIAVGFVEGSAGGVATSDNNGTTFYSSGTSTPTNYQSIGLNTSENLVVLADKGLFTRTATGWETMGTSANFTAFCSTPVGAMYVVGTHLSFASSNNGKSWTPVPMPDIPPTGLGEYRTPVLLGLENGECLVSKTYYRTDLSKHTNGILSRITPNGILDVLKNSTNFVWMVRDAKGMIYARTDNFVTQQRSSNNGNSFTEVTQLAPGFVFTNDNRAINYNGSNGFTISNADFTSTQPLTMSGLTGMPWVVTQGVVNKQNHLFLLSLDQGLFESTAGL